MMMLHRYLLSHRLDRDHRDDRELIKYIILKVNIK